MSNITLQETSNFSEQLGIYDFFNVIISGAVFIFGLCSINQSLYQFLLNDIDVIKGLGIVLLIYIVGLILQEAAYFVDKKTFDIYKTMNRSIIKDTFDENGKRKLSNEIIDNSLLIERYRKLADNVLCDLDRVIKMSDLIRYNDEEVNGFFFSVCQYYVAVNGKDKKIEKMRALYGMSKILMVSFGMLAIISVFIFQKNSVLGSILKNIFKSMAENIIWITQMDIFFYKVMVASIFFGIASIFYFRTKRIMRYFLLILLGTYDAIIRLENEEKSSCVQNNTGLKARDRSTNTREQLSKETGVSTAKQDVVIKEI